MDAGLFLAILQDYERRGLQVHPPLTSFKAMSNGGLAVKLNVAGNDEEIWFTSNGVDLQCRVEPHKNIYTILKNRQLALEKQQADLEAEKRQDPPGDGKQEVEEPAKQEA